MRMLFVGHSIHQPFKKFTLVFPKTARKYTLHFQFYDAIFIGILKNDDKYTYVGIIGIKKRGLFGIRRNKKNTSEISDVFFKDSS